MLVSLWGFNILPNMEAYSLTKLFLDSNAELVEFDDKVLQQTVSLGHPNQTLQPEKENPPPPPPPWMLWSTTYLMF